MNLKPLLLFGMLSTGAIQAATLSVGPGQPYARPCQAIAAAAAGDTILIDAAGTYSGDVCSWSKNRLTLRGVNGRPRIDAAGKYAAGKGTWVIDGNDTIIDNIEFTGAAVPDMNGAGIRLGGKNLTIRRCYFHHNENGLLTNNTIVGGGEILIEFSEFAFNGVGGKEPAHNMYIGHVDKFIMMFSYSHDTVEGHLVKTRGAENYILYNRITGESGTTSYNIDIPNGGLTYIIGNVIQQGPNESNNTILTYMGESGQSNPSRELFVINNTFVNSQPDGIFIRINPSLTTPAVIQNNILAGPGTAITQPFAVTARNLITSDFPFINDGTFDYQLRSGSPAIGAGITPGTGGGKPLGPEYEYVHPACGRVRPSVDTMDVGAFAFSNFAPPLACGPATGPSGLAGILVNQAAVIGGAAGKGTVMLDYVAPAGGITVALVSSNAPVAAGPSTVVVPAGFTSADFAITTGGVVANTSVTLTATYSGVSKTANLMVSPGASAQFTLSAESLDFGSQTIGSATAKTIMVSNRGTTSVPLSSITLAGTNPADFTLTHTCGASLDTGSNCVVSVTFKPAETGSRLAAIVLTGSSPLAPQSIQLSGVGVAQSRGLPGGSTIVFGRETVGTPSSAKTVVFSNPGVAELNISGIAIVGTQASDFGQTNDCPPTLGAAASCTISIVFTPGAEGIRSARVNIEVVAPASTNTITLSGTGIANPQIQVIPGRKK